MQKYLRIPYKLHGSSFDGCDCGGLLRLVFREELRIFLPDWTNQYNSTHREGFKDIADIIGSHTSTMGDFPLRVDLEDAQPFDGVALRMGPLTVHVGVVVRKGKMLHIQEGEHAIIDDYTGLKWQRRLVGVYRHVSRI